MGKIKKGNSEDLKLNVQLLRQAKKDRGFKKLKFIVILNSIISKKILIITKSIKMETSYHQNSGSLLYNKNEDDDLKPEDLSGDQNGEKSIFASTMGTSKANFMLTTITIVKTVIGSSILIVPYTISQLGYVFGTLAFVLAIACNQFGTALLLKSKNLSGHSNFATILHAIWKNNISKCLGFILIFLNNIGFCIAQTIIFKSSIRKILEDVVTNQQVLDSFYAQEYFIVLIFALMEVPFVIVSKMEKLKFTALLGVIGIIIFVVVFIVLFLQAVADSNPNNNPVGDMKMFPSNWLLAAATLPNTILAMSHQMNLFPVFKGMRNVTDKRMNLAVFVAMLFCAVCYLVIGILGYDLVGSQVAPNFLESLTYNKIAPAYFFIANFSFMLCLFFAFPIMFFGCRNNFIALVKLAIFREKGNQERGEPIKDDIDEISSYMIGMNEAEKKRKARFLFLAYTMIIYAITIGVSLAVDNIQIVYNAIGAVCSFSIAIVLPCIFYMRLLVKNHKEKTKKYYLSFVLVCIIVPYAIFSVIALYVGIE